MWVDHVVPPVCRDMSLAHLAAGACWQSVITVLARPIRISRLHSSCEHQSTLFCSFPRRRKDGFSHAAVRPLCCSSSPPSTRIWIKFLFAKVQRKSSAAALLALASSMTDHAGKLKNAAPCYKHLWACAVALLLLATLRLYPLHGPLQPPVAGAPPPPLVPQGEVPPNCLHLTRVCVDQQQVTTPHDEGRFCTGRLGNGCAARGCAPGHLWCDTRAAASLLLMHLSRARLSPHNDPMCGPRRW